MGNWPGESQEGSPGQTAVTPVVHRQNQNHLITGKKTSQCEGDSLGIHSRRQIIGKMCLMNQYTCCVSDHQHTGTRRTHMCHKCCGSPAPTEASVPSSALD